LISNGGRLGNNNGLVTGCKSIPSTCGVSFADVTEIAYWTSIPHSRAASVGNRALFDCSLRSLRCSLSCRRLRPIWRNGEALFRHLLLQIGGANIGEPATSSSLAAERAPRTMSIARSARWGWRSSASVAQHGGPRFLDARSCSLRLCSQCVVTPLALSHGCGLIALYTSPYLTPAG
jgi:hypothetical protein